MEQSTTPQSADNFYRLGVLIKYALYVLVGLGLFAFWRNYQQQSNAATQFQIEKSERLNIRNNITNYVQASASSFKAVLLGGISELNLTVTNTTSYMLDDVNVEVNYILVDGDIYKKEYVHFPYVGPNQIMTIKAPDSPRGIRVTYQITKITSRALGL